MHRTKESGGLTHEEFLGMWRAYLGLKAERDALSLVAEAVVNGEWEAARELADAALERSK